MSIAANPYLEEQVGTATPAQLTGMLFDGAVAALRGAVRLQEDDKWRAGVQKSLKAQRILMELRGSLDFEAGGEVAQNLDRLYDWSFVSLARATSEEDVDAVRDVMGVLEGLASAWREGVLGQEGAAG